MNNLHKTHNRAVNHHLLTQVQSQLFPNVFHHHMEDKELRACRSKKMFGVSILGSDTLKLTFAGAIADFKNHSRWEIHHFIKSIFKLGEIRTFQKHFYNKAQQLLTEP